MTRYFAGNSLASFSRNSTGTIEAATAGWFDNAYVPSTILFTNNTDTATATFATSAAGTVWIRFDYRTGSSYGSGAIGLLVQNGAAGVFRLAGNGTGIQPQYWNGSAWTATGTAFTPPTASRQTFVVKIDLNSGFDVYVSGALVSSGTGWSGGAVAATAALFGCFTSSSNSNGASQVLVADYNLRDSHYMSAALNGNSASNTGGTGAYTAINETVLDESTLVAVTTAGNKHGQTKAAITVPAGYIIGALVVGGRGRVAGSITDGKLGIRTNAGTDSSGSGLGYNGGYEPRIRIVDNDPDTASPYTQSGFNAVEIYEEAV